MLELQFYNLCQKGLLQEAKQFLLDNPDIDITAFDNMTFRYSCFACNSLHNRLELAKWLQSLKPKLYEIIYDIDGSYKDYVINDKEMLWQKRKYLIWLASDLTPNKNNLLYKIPEDVFRYIIQSYL